MTTAYDLYQNGHLSDAHWHTVKRLDRLARKALRAQDIKRSPKLSSCFKMHTAGNHHTEETAAQAEHQWKYFMACCQIYIHNTLLDQRFIWALIEGTTLNIPVARIHYMLDILRFLLTKSQKHCGISNKKPYRFFEPILQKQSGPLHA
jgi:hypothetical protein